jgi:hypothetical protein
MPNYAKGKVFKIVNTENDTVYIGSTCMELKAHFAVIVSQAKHGNLGHDNQFTEKLRNAIKKIGAEKFSIHLIKAHPCLSRHVLVSEECAVIERYRAKGISLYNSKTSRLSGYLAKQADADTTIWLLSHERSK